MTIAFSFLPGALALAIAGCGGGGGAAAVTQASFCIDKAEAECDQVVPKCMFDEPACVTARTAACNARANSQLSTTRIFKPTNTGACLSKVKAVLGKKDPITGAEWQDMTEVCDRVWEGDGEQQALCSSPYDCLKPFICDKGQCQKLVRQGAKDPCTNPGEVCPEAQYCQKGAPDAAGNVFSNCTDRVAMSQACGGVNGAQCTQELFCRNSLCASKLANLTACQVDGECTSGLCDPFAKVCVTTIGFALGATSCSGFLGTAAPMPDAAAPVTPMPDAMSSTDAAAGN